MEERSNSSTVISVSERSAKRSKPSQAEVKLIDLPQHRTVEDFSSPEALRGALLELAENTASTGSSHDTSSCQHSTCSSSMQNNGAPPARDWLLDNVDPETGQEQDLEQEVSRLMDLKSYMILETLRMDARDTPFDRLVEMAESLFDNRFISVITLVDLGRQCFLTNNVPTVGKIIPRRVGLCSHTVLHKGDVMIVPDCLQDERFKENPFVTGFYKMRFYAGAPLVSKQGCRLGAFCLVDVNPHPEGLTGKEKKTLKNLARLAMEALENHRIIQSQRMQLSHASQALASAAHDLLTPLTGIQLSTTLLSEDPDFTRKLKTSEKETLRTAGHCLDTMVGICESLRNTKEVLMQQQQPHHHSAKTVPLLTNDPNEDSSSTVFNIHNTVERLHKVVTATPNKVPLHVVLDPSVPALVIGNEVTVFRAALNLLNVSAQRTVSGFVRLTVRTDDGSSSPEQPQLVFQCEDTGPVRKDLPPQQEGHAQHILLSRKDADWILPTTASDQETSSFSYLISHLEDLGSTLAVTPQIHNNKDQSSGLLSTLCFSFRLPLVVPECDTKVIVEPDSDMLQDCESDSGTETLEPNKTTASASQCISSSTRRRSVLVVDDSPVIRKVIGRALSQIGIDSTMACNGLEGLQLMKERGYDFVLLDFLMPVMDGLDVIRELRQWEKEHRPALRQHVVGISAHASDSDADQGILLGMNAYQRKPLKLEDLRNIADSEDAATMSKLLDDTLCERCRTAAESINPGPKESCLVATDSSTQETVITTLQENGWVPATASSKHELLDKLRSRNWEAVVLDSDFLTSVQEFREWEMHNRIHRQRNCFVLSNSSFKPTSSAQSSVNLPQGIDGVLSKPATSEEMKKMLSMARSHNPLSFTADDIVTR